MDFCRIDQADGIVVFGQKISQWQAVYAGRFQANQRFNFAIHFSEPRDKFCKSGGIIGKSLVFIFVVTKTCGIEFFLSDVNADSDLKYLCFHDVTLTFFKELGV